MPSLSPNPTRFLLVRHAQTLWNKEHRLAGSSEVPLSPGADRQIAKLTRRLVGEPVSVIYSSPLQRCQNTIADLAFVLDLPVLLRNDLKERNLGKWAGKSAAELASTYPGYHFPESAYTGDYRIPQAEPLDHLEQRIRLFLHRAGKKHTGQTIVVSTHSGVIWSILHRIVANPPATFFWPGNCSISTVLGEGHHYTLKDFEPLD